MDALSGVDGEGDIGAGLAGHGHSHHLCSRCLDGVDTEIVDDDDDGDDVGGGGVGVR